MLKMLRNKRMIVLNTTYCSTKTPCTDRFINRTTEYTSQEKEVLFFARYYTNLAEVAKVKEPIFLRSKFVDYLQQLVNISFKSLFSLPKIRTLCQTSN